MKGIELFDAQQWHLLSWAGVENNFLTVNADTIINTWITLFVLLICMLLARFALTYRVSVARYLILNFVRGFIDLCSQSFGFFSYNHTAFIIAIFTFIIFCNCIAIIPFVDEPTKDLNTTFALGLITFLYIQYFAIKTHGIIGYIKEFFTPIFLMFPLHVIGKLSTVISISFRLFGNIFGSATVMHIYQAVLNSSWIFQVAGLITGLNFLLVGFFVLFEGFLQAFVFTMLAMTYLAIAITHDDEDIGEMT